MQLNKTDRNEVEKTIHDNIGWALTKDLDRLFATVAQDDDFFIFHPDSKSTIVGFEAFKNMGARVWMNEAFKATDYAIKDLRVTFAQMGNIAWYSCYLDDHAEWKGQPIGWDNCRWTGTVEKRGGNWVIASRYDNQREPHRLNNSIERVGLNLGLQIRRRYGSRGVS